MVLNISCRKVGQGRSATRDLFTAETTGQSSRFFWTYLAGEQQSVLCDVRCREGYNPMTNPPPAASDRLLNCSDQVRAVSISAVSIPPQIDKFIRNPQTTGGTQSQNIRAQVEAIFASLSADTKTRTSTKTTDEIVDLSQTSDEIQVLDQGLTASCSKPASMGIISSTGGRQAEAANDQGAKAEFEYTMDSQVWMDVYTNYNTHIEGHKVHSFELRRFGGVNDDGSYRWIGLKPETRHFELIILGQELPQYFPPGSANQLKKGDLIEVLDPSINKVLFPGSIAGMTKSHAIIQVPANFVGSAGESNVDRNNHLAINWDSATRKIRKTNLKSMDAKSREAVTGTCSLVCSYSHQNYLSGNYFYVWKKSDQCNPGFRCGANTLNLNENEHCAKEYHGVAHNVTPRQLGCFQ